jgi:hypothetical protein
MAKKNNQKQHKPQQVRKTFEDTFNFQNELLELIDKKKKRNTPFNQQQRERANYLYPRAILSHGIVKFSFRHNGRVSLFRHISSFFSKLSRIASSTVVLTDSESGEQYEVQISDLWAALEEELEYLFPYAREEAIHMSSEAPVYEQATSYAFSMDKKI